ncbi:PDZ domain-containing protein [Candidatus Gracilibacteria bacterium]|nr:PDZ domain-containing protein [Candidatus Gracilibacteria bacterium]
MKKFLILIIALTLSSQTAFALYNDVPEEHEYYYAINALQRLNRLPEYASNSFDPDKKANFIDLYEMIFAFTRTPLTSEINLPYTNTENDAPYAPILQSALNFHLTQAQGAKPQFNPNLQVTKGQALKTLFSSLGIGTDTFFDKENYIFIDLSPTSKLAPIAQKAAQLFIFEDKATLFKMAKRPTRGEIADYILKINNHIPTSEIIIEIQNTSNSSNEFTKTENTLIQHPGFDSLLTTWTKIKEDYPKNSEIGEQELIYSAIEGLVDALGDKYSAFQTPLDAENLLNSINGNYQGLGMVVEMIEEQVTIIAPMKNSPAEEAGLKSGDIITKVDDQEIAGLNLQEATAKIKGPAGTDVKLEIVRDSSILNFTITRAEISTTTVTYEVQTNSLGTKLGYIDISLFSENTYVDFLKAAEALIAEDVRGFIIDLRNNPGGIMLIAVNIIGEFTELIVPGVILEYSNNKLENINTSGNGLIKDYQSVILVNEGSASASEIVAGTLQDLNTSTILGQTTFGKGTVQEVEVFDDNSLLKLTISKWLTRDGRSINSIGVTPDIIFGDIESTIKDEQLLKAQEQFR